MATPTATTSLAPVATMPPLSSLPRLPVLANGTPASVRHDGDWYPLSTGPVPKRPVLRLAGDADDAGLEPHICRSID